MIVNPFNLMPTSDPGKFPELFNNGKPFTTTSVVDRPVFKRPGVFTMLAKQAFEFVGWLNLIGFSFALPVYKGPDMEGHLVSADINDTTPREYLASHKGQIGEHLLALVVDNLGGVRSSPNRGLTQLIAETGVNPETIQDLTDAQIVASLQRIFA